MSKTVKMISALLIVLMLAMTITSNVFAADSSQVLTQLQSDITGATVDTTKVSSLAGRIIKFIQYVAIIGGAIILAVLGVKYMMGSVEEKAEYKKSFIPLIVGIVVVMGAISIANLLFNTFSGI